MLVSILLTAFFMKAAFAIECITNFNATFDYFPPAARSLARITDPTLLGNNRVPIIDASTVTYADRFTVYYFNSYKVIDNLRTQEQYILYQCGSPVPSDSAVLLPTGFTRKKFEVPLKRVAATETVSLTYLEILDSSFNPLGVTDRLFAVTGYAVGQCFQKLLDCNASSATGVPTLMSDEGNPPNTLQAQIDSTDAYLTSPYGFQDYKPEKAIVFDAAQEVGALERAEWIKFLAPFFNLEHEANEYFYYARNNFTRISDAVKVAVPSDQRPLVAFISHQDEYISPDYSAPELFIISLAGYKTDLIKNAGGRFFTVNSTELSAANFSVPFYAGSAVYQKADFGNDRNATIAAFRAALASIDVVIDETYYFDPRDATLASVTAALQLTQPGDAQAFKFLRNGQLFREDKTIAYEPTAQSWGLDWFESLFARPMDALLDFVQALHPTISPRVIPELAGYSARYLRNLSNNEASVEITGQNCAAQFPACDASVKELPICSQWDYKVCTDGSPVFRNPLDLCATYLACAKAAPSGARGTGPAALLAVLLLLSLLLL